MKKGIFLAIVVIAMCCIFCGCAEEAAGCTHRWIDATCEEAKICVLCAEVAEAPLGHDFSAAACETPKTCTRCGSTDGEALGHTFSAATCTAPETCKVCGVTQGEALLHDYSKWTIIGEEMTRKCEDCRNSETVPIDWALYLQGKMTGYWEFYYSLEKNSTAATVYWYDIWVFSDAEEHARITEDWKIQYFGNWAQVTDRPNTDNFQVEPADIRFERYEVIDGVAYYWCSIVDSVTNVERSACFMEDDRTFILEVDTENAKYYFQKYPQEVQYMSGVWAGIQGDVLYRLDLNEDGTLLLSAPEYEVHGTWHMKPMVEDEMNPGFLTLRMLFCYETQGKTEFRTADMLLGTSLDEVWERIFKNNLHNMYPFQTLAVSLPEEIESTSVCNMRYMDEAVFRLMEEAMETPFKERLVGRWESVTAGTGGGSTQNETGYAIEFREDGTFTQTGDVEHTGTWMLHEVKYNAGLKCVEFSVYVEIDGSETNSWVYLSSNNELTSHIDDPARCFEKCE